MAKRRSNRKPVSRAVPAQTQKQVGSDFWKSFGASNPNNTTPSTPTTPNSGSGPGGGKGGGGSRGAASGGGGVDENRQRAYSGDDSQLLPYRPTQTINPARPRTLAAGYDAENEVLFVRFRDGAGYEYHDVDRSQWREFKATPSPGRYINRELNHHPYNPADW